VRVCSPKGLPGPLQLPVMFLLTYLLLNHLSLLSYLTVLREAFVSFPLRYLSHTAVFSGHAQSLPAPCSGSVTSGHVLVSSLVVCLNPQHPLYLSKSCAETRRSEIDPKPIIFLIMKKIPYKCAPLFKNSAFHVLFVLPLRLVKTAAFGRACFLTRLPCC